MRARRVAMRGVVSSAGFESGDRFVCGNWLESPIGAFTDLMWSSSKGHRTLFVASEAALDFVSGIYAFDGVEVEPVAAHLAGHSLDVEVGPIELHLQGGWPRPIPFGRSSAFVRFVHGPVAFVAMGVRTFGVSPMGVREWYRADVYRRVVAGAARVDGRDLGALAPLVPPVRFGFSEPPRRSSMVWLRPLLEYPDGHDGPPEPGVRPAGGA